MAGAGQADAASPAQQELLDVYNFPPMYTIQRVPATRERQCEMWCGLLVDRCRAEKAWGLGLEAPVFDNKAINRKLSTAGARTVLQALVASGRGAWRAASPGAAAPSKQTAAPADYCWVFWQPLDHWAGLVYNKAQDEGNVGGVCTLYELTDDAAKDTPWEGMPE
eukprot:gene16236-24882_t